MRFQKWTERRCSAPPQYLHCKIEIQLRRQPKTFNRSLFVGFQLLTEPPTHWFSLKFWVSEFEHFYKSSGKYTRYTLLISKQNKRKRASSTKSMNRNNEKAHFKTIQSYHASQKPHQYKSSSKMCSSSNYYAVGVLLELNVLLFDHFWDTTETIVVLLSWNMCGRRGRQ